MALAGAVLSAGKSSLTAEAFWGSERASIQRWHGLIAVCDALETHKERENGRHGVQW